MPSPDPIRILNIGSGGISMFEATEDMRPPDRDVLEEHLDLVNLPIIKYHTDATVCEGVPRDYYDCVYASHIIEHFPRSKLGPSLTLWLSLLRSGGFIFIRTPDFSRIAAAALQIGLNGVLYTLPNGRSITCRDAIWGLEEDIDRGQIGMRHVTGYDAISLEAEVKWLKEDNKVEVVSFPDIFELVVRIVKDV